VSSSSRRLAITGVDGFVGRHVAELAAGQGWQVVGLAHRAGLEPDLEAHLSEYHAVDLRLAWPVSEPVDAVIHLAGLAAVGPSFSEPQKYIEWNSAIVTTMCEAIIARAGAPTRVVGVSTGAVYASAVAGIAVDEGSPVSASSPHVISKLIVECQFEYYCRRGIDAVVARPFNHIGPGQAEGFLVPDLVTQLQALEAGAPLLAGNLASARDYTDVRDVARAYLSLASAPNHANFVYNVASGRPRTGQEMLELIVGALGVPVPSMETDASKLRAIDASHIRGSAERLRVEFGWEPAISVEQSVVDYVRSISKSAGPGGT